MPESSEEAVRQAVAVLLSRHDPSLRPGPADELFSSGMLNSLFALELVAFLEGRYAIRFSGDELDLTRFSSLDTIARTVIAKQAAATGDRHGR